MNEEKILAAGTDLLEFLSDEETDLKTVKVSIVVDLPESVVALATEIATSLGMKDQVDAMLGSMASQGILTQLQGMVPQQEKKPAVDEETKAAFEALGGGLEKLTEKLATLEGLKNAVESTTREFNNAGQDK